MSDEQRRSPEPLDALARCDAERFAELLGRAGPRDPAHPAWRDERYLAWLAAELRDRDRAARRTSDAAFLARGDALMARAQARRLRVACLGAPTLRDAEPRGEPAVPVVELGVAAGVGRELWDEPAERWVMLPPELPDARYVALRIVGTSMTPLMHSGDTVLVRVGAQVSRDTVIVARHPDDGYLCKRVHRIRREVIELASLERGRPIVEIPRRGELIVGTVVLVWCDHEPAPRTRAARGALSRTGPSTVHEIASKR